MANQAIALQARAPQMDIMGRAIQQNAQMMNMMSQQRAAQRQAAVAAQEMEIARAAEKRAAAKEGRDIEKFAVDQDALLYAKYRNMAPAVIESNSPEVYREWLGALVEESPERGAIIAQAMPVERFDAAALSRMMATMDDFFAAKYGKAITRELIHPVTGAVSAANISSLPGASFSQPVPDISRPRAGATPMQTPMSAPGAPPATAPKSAFPTTAAPATDEQIDAAAQKILRGAGVGELGISAEDFDRASARANQLSAGGGARMQPISMTTGAQMGGQPDMTAVVQDMMSSGQISQSNLQLMREMAGPDKDAQLAQILKANNIQIVPDEQPQMRSAVFRPDQGAAPQMQRVQFNPNDYEQARAKPTGESPTPGIYNVPTPVIKGVKAAETQGSEDVRVQTQPTITAKEERIRRVEKLRGDLPVAKNATSSLIADIDDRINSIDRLLSNKYRFSIVGPIEGNLPRLFQMGTRADVQADFDKIKNTATLTELTKLKTSTETGGSPLGSNPTDRDAKIVETAASALIQTGEPAKFDKELLDLRRKLYRMRTTAANTYNDTFREVLPEDPRMKLQVPVISDVYKGAPPPAGKRKTPTGGAVDKNNPLLKGM